MNKNDTYYPTNILHTYYTKVNYFNNQDLISTYNLILFIKFTQCMI